jgi:hypothetical protein
LRHKWQQKRPFAISQIACIALRHPPIMRASDFSQCIVAPSCLANRENHNSLKSLNLFLNQTLSLSHAAILAEPFYPVKRSSASVHYLHFKRSLSQTTITTWGSSLFEVLQWWWPLDQIAQMLCQSGARHLRDGPLLLPYWPAEPRASA